MSRESAALASLSTSIGLLASVLAAAPRASAQALPGIQEQLDAIAESVRFAEGCRRDTPGDAIINIAPQLSSISGITRLDSFGRRVDIFVDVRASAQHATLFLSMGGTSLDLTAATSYVQFVFQGTPSGRSLTFASGTSLASIADSINSLSKPLSLHARVSGTGIRLESDLPGSNGFISVRVLHAGGLEQIAGTGIYRTMSSDAHRAAVASRVPLDTAVACRGVADIGRDVQATVNGASMRSEGATIDMRTQWVDGWLDLPEHTPPGVPGAQRLGRFRAFTIIPWSQMP